MYIGVGAIKNDKIIITDNALYLIDDDINKIVFVRSTNGYGTKVRDGVLYSIGDVVYDDAVDFFTINTFRTLFDLGLISHHYSDEHMWFLLVELVKLTKNIPEEIYEYVYQNGIEECVNSYNLKGLLSLVENSIAARWILNKGIKCENVSGYGNVLEYLIMRAEIFNENSVIEVLCDYPDALDIEYLETITDKCNTTKNESVRKMMKIAIDKYAL